MFQSNSETDPICLCSPNVVIFVLDVLVFFVLYLCRASSSTQECRGNCKLHLLVGQRVYIGWVLC